MQLANCDKPFDYNKDDTPIKNSDHLIEDDKIEIDFSEGNQGGNFRGSIRAKNQDDDPTDPYTENIANFATDRKFTETDGDRRSTVQKGQ